MIAAVCLGVQGRQSSQAGQTLNRGDFVISTELPTFQFRYTFFQIGKLFGKGHDKLPSAGAGAHAFN